MTISDIDAFFAAHPLGEQFSSFSAGERADAAVVAERDVFAAAGDVDLTVGRRRELYDAAIAEQTIFLLLNPEYLTGRNTRLTAESSAGESRRFSTPDAVLGQRAAALLAPLISARRTGADDGPLHLSRG